MNALLSPRLEFRAVEMELGAKLAAPRPRGQAEAEVVAATPADSGKWLFHDDEDKPEFASGRKRSGVQGGSLGVLVSWTPMGPFLLTSTPPAVTCMVYVL
jgi:hypothetical protein